SAATGCATTHGTPSIGMTTTGFHSTAIARNTITHHQCFACTANQATMSARIVTMNRTGVKKSVPMMAMPMKSVSAARIPGASALRCRAPAGSVFGTDGCLRRADDCDDDEADTDADDEVGDVADEQVAVGEHVGDRAA